MPSSWTRRSRSRKRSWAWSATVLPAGLDPWLQQVGKVGASGSMGLARMAELNAVIHVLTKGLNNRPMRHLGMSRRTLFEAVECPALLALLSEPYAYAGYPNCRGLLGPATLK